MKRVRNNIYKYKKNSLNLVADWFEPRSHNHDYVSKIAKFNKIMITKSMPKEETAYTFKAKNCRLQLVELYSTGQTQIRLNRKIVLTTYKYEEAVARFRALVYQHVNTLNLF